MKYLKYTYVDAVTGISVADAPAKNGPTHPDIPGLVFGFALESQYPTTTPTHFGTAPDASDVGMPGVLGEISEAEYQTAYDSEAQARVAAVWEKIKTERDRRKYLGVKVGDHWFHSDDPSRIQLLALVMMGNAIPPELEWKTLTLTPPPVFVAMTPALAAGIFQATAASDQAIFAAAEVHRVAMEAFGDPEAYDLSAGWPVSIEDSV